MPDKLREKYLDLFYKEKIAEHRSSHPEDVALDDMDIRIKLNIHFTGDDAKKNLTEFLHFCIKKELESRIAAAEKRIVDSYREINEIDSWKYTDEEIIKMVPVSPIEIIIMEKEIREEFLYMVAQEIKSLEKENIDNKELQEKTNSSILYSELNSDISNISHNISEREMAASILEEDISNRGL